MAFKRILVAVDSGPVAIHAADVAAELARSLAAEMGFVHVIDTSLNYVTDTGVLQHDLAEAARQEGRRVVGDFRRRLAPQAVEFVQVGIPATEIVKAAQEWPADLIVIGSHGRKGLQRTLLGSVAEGVVRHASCPVMVVRAHE